jgi:hypothetical protein
MSKLTRRTNQVVAESGNLHADNYGQSNDQMAVANAVSRRSFLKRSGLMAGGAALASSMSPVMMKKAEAANSSLGKTERGKDSLHPLFRRLRYYC